MICDFTGKVYGVIMMTSFLSDIFENLCLGSSYGLGPDKIWYSVKKNKTQLRAGGGGAFCPSQVENGIKVVRLVGAKIQPKKNVSVFHGGSG